MKHLLQLLTLIFVISGGIFGRQGNTKSCAGKCGIEKNCPSEQNFMDLRIGGGDPTEMNQSPWMIYVRASYEITDGWRYFSKCGGSLIASRYVLTAAHCLTGLGENKDKEIIPSISEVWIGDHNIETEEKTCLGKKSIGIKRFKYHEDYNQQSLNNDIAILELEEEVDLGIYTPVCLPAPGDDFTEKMDQFYAYGWGEGSGTILHQIQFDKLTKIKESPNFYYYERKDGKQTGKGDSGGPVTFKQGNSHTLAGVISHGASLCKHVCPPFGTCHVTCTEPDGFVIVSKYLQWINRFMDSPQFCDEDEPSEEFSSEEEPSNEFYTEEEPEEPSEEFYTDNEPTEEFSSEEEPCKDIYGHCPELSEDHCWLDVVKRDCKESCGLCEGTTPATSDDCYDEAGFICSSLQFFCDYKNVFYSCRKSCKGC